MPSEGTNFTVVMRKNPGSSGNGQVSGFCTQVECKPMV